MGLTKTKGVFPNIKFVMDNAEAPSVPFSARFATPPSNTKADTDKRKWGTGGVGEIGSSTRNETEATGSGSGNETGFTAIGESEAKDGVQGGGIYFAKKFAAQAHDEWRKGFDPEYAATGVASKQRLKKNDDGTEGNINVPFDQLNETWQKENMAAGLAAYDAVVAHSDNIEQAAEYIHNEWMKRNPKQDWNASQHVPYLRLAEDEKEKDRMQAREMQKILSTRTIKKQTTGSGYSPEELKARLAAVKKASEKATKKGEKLSAEEREKIFKQNLPKEIVKNIEKTKRQLEDLRKRDLNNIGEKDIPSELSDKELAALVLKHKKLFDRQNQLSEEQREEEYPEPIKTLDQYKTINELQKDMATRLTKEEKEQRRRLAIASGSKVLAQFTGKNDGAKYELIQATNADALAEHAKGSHWCVQNPDTAAIYLSDSVANSFYILKKDGKPLVAIRKNAETVSHIHEMGGNAKPGAVEMHHFVDQDMVSGEGYSDYESGIYMAKDDLAAARSALDKLGYGDVEFKLPIETFKNNETQQELFKQSVANYKPKLGEITSLEKLLFTTGIELTKDKLIELAKTSPYLLEKVAKNNKIDLDKTMVDVNGKQYSLKRLMEEQNLLDTTNHLTKAVRLAQEALLSGDYSQVSYAVKTYLENIIYLQEEDEKIPRQSILEKVLLEAPIVPPGSGQNGIDIDSINYYVDKVFMNTMTNAELKTLDYQGVKLIANSDNNAFEKYLKALGGQSHTVVTVLNSLLSSAQDSEDRELAIERMGEYIETTGLKPNEIPKAWLNPILEYVDDSIENGTEAYISPVLKKIANTTRGSKP